MKGAVVYDSVYGNTRLVAEAIAEQIRASGHEAEVISLKEGGAKEVRADFMFVGGPTRMKKMTRSVKRFVKKLDRTYWNSRTVFAYDTYGPLGKTEEEKRKGAKWLVPGAVGSIQTLGNKMGLKMSPKTLRCAVTDLKGPLEPNALDSARAFTREALESLDK